MRWSNSASLILWRGLAPCSRRRVSEYGRSHTRCFSAQSGQRVCPSIVLSEQLTQRPFSLLFWRLSAARFRLRARFSSSVRRGFFGLVAVRVFGCPWPGLAGLRGTEAISEVPSPEGMCGDDSGSCVEWVAVFLRWGCLTLLRRPDLPLLLGNGTVISKILLEYRIGTTGVL